MAAEAGEEESDERARLEAAGVGVVTVIQDDEAAYIVELNGIRFEPNRNQVRADGTLTAGGVKIYEAAKARAEAESN
ncbi:hypothetical protein D9M68_1003610 [compost metagenome]